MARKPKMAKALAVNTKKGSWVTAKIAGIESTAKIRSVNSTSSNTNSSGVASQTPLRRTHILPPA